jgi:CheY-like chemotaxis protein
MVSEDSSALEGYRVLIVDDDIDSAELLQFFLEGHGAVVKLCASGQEALTTFAHWRPQALISDIAMPLMDGYSLIRQIRSLQDGQDEYVIAIAFSAMARGEDKQRSLDAGFDHYLAKPLDLDAVISVLINNQKK